MDDWRRKCSCEKQGVNHCSVLGKTSIIIAGQVSNVVVWPSSAGITLRKHKMQCSLLQEKYTFFPISENFFLGGRRATLVEKVHYIMLKTCSVIIILFDSFSVRVYNFSYTMTSVAIYYYSYAYISLNNNKFS